jgi:hypothetical protein
MNVLQQFVPCRVIAFHAKLHRSESLPYDIYHFLLFPLSVKLSTPQLRSSRFFFHIFFSRICEPNTLIIRIAALKPPKNPPVFNCQKPPHELSSISIYPSSSFPPKQFEAKRDLITNGTLCCCGRIRTRTNTVCRNT